MKSAVDQKNYDAIEGLTKALNDAWAAASEDLYKAQGGGSEQANAGNNQQSSNSAGGDAEDVEFEEVK